MGLAQEEGGGRTKLERALHSKMEQDAQKKCSEYLDKYSECSEKKLLFASRRCSKQFKEYNDCMRQYCNDSVLEEMKHKYSL